MSWFTAFTTLSVTSWMVVAVSPDSVASFRISSATTANPFPISPARAASMEAFKDKRLVWLVISMIACARTSIRDTTSTSCSAWSRLSLISPCMRCALARFSVVSFFALMARVWMSLTRSAPSCALSAMFLIARLISSDMVFISVADAADSSMLAASCCVVAEMPSISPLISSTFFPMEDTWPLRDSALSFTLPRCPAKLSRILWKAAARFPMLSFLSKYFCSTSCVRSPCARVSE